MGSVFHSHGQIGPLQLGLTILTFIIGNGWLLVQILWFRSVNRESVAFWLYLFIILFYAATEVVNIVHPKHGALYNIITISGCAFYIYSSFVFRRELEKHYNEAEPIGLKLTGVMTFFFNSYYFQYYFRKIALLKDEAAAIPAPPTA